MVPRFFLKGPLTPASRVTLPPEEAHHLRIYRLRPGDSLELVNGQGTLATARLDADSIFILSSSTTPKTPSLHLAIPLMRQLDWAVEKATELGADSLHLYRADAHEKSSYSLSRLEGLTIAAMKQSRRLFLPTLSIHDSLDDVLKLSVPLFFGDFEGSPLSDAPLPCLIVTGPEKGFSSRELSLLRKQGTGILLHDYTLRAETAPLAALSQFWVVRYRS